MQQQVYRLMNKLLKVFMSLTVTVEKLLKTFTDNRNFSSFFFEEKAKHKSMKTL